jgi:hypothetical protein
MDGHRPRPTRLLVALLALLAVALTAPAAHADDSPATRWPAGGSTLRTALAMGAEHWGMTPCGGRVDVYWSGLAAGTNAQSSWANAVDPYRQPSSNTECEIALSTGTAWDWVKLCTVVIHEVGHLTGHDHVDDPGDIMYFAYVQPAPECAATPQPVETGPPVVPAAAPRSVPRPVAKKTAANKKAAKKTAAKKRAKTPRRRAARHR